MYNKAKWRCWTAIELFLWWRSEWVRSFSKDWDPYRVYDMQETVLSSSNPKQNQYTLCMYRERHRIFALFLLVQESTRWVRRKKICLPVVCLSPVDSIPERQRKSPMLDHDRCASVRTATSVKSLLYSRVSRLSSAPNWHTHPLDFSVCGMCSP